MTSSWILKMLHEVAANDIRHDRVLQLADFVPEEILTKITVKLLQFKLEARISGSLLESNKH